ncbi:MAG: hypothetical protein IJB16_02970 [Clostridia bacterium]|nr:hypothetical protein [Clostridia bacterium]
MKIPRIVNSVGHIDDDLINDAVKSEKSSKKNVWIKWTSLAACFAVVLIVAVVAGPIMSGNRNIAPSVDSGNINPVIDNSATNTSSNIEETSAQANSEEPDISVSNEEITPSESNNETNPPVPNEETHLAVNNETTQSVTSNEFSGYKKSYFYKVDDDNFSSYIGGKVINKDKLGEKISDVTVTAGWETWVGEKLTETVSTENLRAEVYLINGVSNDVAVALKFIDKGEAVTTTHYYVILNPDADLSSVKEYIIPYSVPSYTSYKTDGEETVVDEIAGEELTVTHTKPSVAE